MYFIDLSSMWAVLLPKTALWSLDSTGLDFFCAKYYLV